VHQLTEGDTTEPVTTAIQSFTEQTVEVAGKKVRVLQDGTGDPVVVLHHSTGNPGWTPFFEHLASKNALTVPDMPGYGQSERPQWARDPRDIAILVHHTLDKFGLEKVALVGVGFGGYIAAEMAAMNQHRLSSLVLVGAAGLQPDEGEILDQMLIDFPEYVRAGFRDDAAYESVFGAEPEPPIKELWDFSREMTARITWKPYMFSRRLAPTLADVETPTLIIWGSEDRVVPPSCAKQYAAALPNAKVEMIDGAGHLVEYEDPERVAKLIAQHIAGN
jgi:pimeloyl-ACP methyl ester carboxylesterase